MKYQKIMNLLNESSDSKFKTRDGNIVNDQSNANYKAGKKIIHSIEVLKSNLCDYNNACILVRGNIIIEGNIVAQIVFENCAPLFKCITKIDGRTTDLVIPTSDLLECCSNHSDMTGSLWFYSNDEPTNFNVNIEDTNNLKSFKYKTKLIGSTAAANRILENAKITVQLKYLSNF